MPDSMHPYFHTSTLLHFITITMERFTK